MKWAGVLLAGVAAATQPATAQDGGATLAERFAARPAVLDARLSPAGTQVAMLVPQGEDGEALRVADLAGTAEWRVVMSNDRPLTDLDWCDWVNERRLICQVSALGSTGESVTVGMRRLIALDADGGNVQLLSERVSDRAFAFVQDGGEVVAWQVAGAGDNAVLLTRTKVAEESTGSIMLQEKEGLGVDLVDVSTRRRRPVERPRPNAQWYLADETGVVRMVQDRSVTGTGYLREGGADYMFRPKAGGDWRRLSPGSGAPADFRPAAIDGAADVVYGFGTHDGFDALFSIALDGTGAGRLLLAQPGSDVDRLIRLGNGGRVVGASYATEKRRIELFDPQLQQVLGSLQAALPGSPQIELIDASTDESRLLLTASSDVDPGRVYLFDRTSGKMGEIAAMRPELAGLPMGTMQAISYPAADGTPIPAYLTVPPGSDGKNLPAVVVPHGGPSARDEWGFDWLVQYLVHRGYAVLQPNFRGSAGYGDAWFQRNGFQSWETAVSDINAAGQWLARSGTARGDRLAVVGWSYGGYAALQSPALDPELFKAIVAIAPVTDLERLSQDARHFINYRLVSSFVGQGPHVSAGSPVRHPEKIRAPVLLFHGTADQNVDVTHSRAMNVALQRAERPVSYVEYDGAQHGITQPEARADMLRRIDALLAQMSGE